MLREGIFETQRRGERRGCVPKRTLRPLRLCVSILQTPTGLTSHKIPGAIVLLQLKSVLVAGLVRVQVRSNAFRLFSPK